MALEKYNDMLSYLIKLKSATLDKFSNNIYCIKLKKMPNKINFLIFLSCSNHTTIYLNINRNKRFINWLMK